MERLIEAIFALVHEMREARKCAPATKQDIENAKQEIIKAFGDRIDPEALRKATADLKAHADALKKVVADNQPLSG
jgi:hypothetical protein